MHTQTHKHTHTRTNITDKSNFKKLVAHLYNIPGLKAEEGEHTLHVAKNNFQAITSTIETIYNQ